MKFDSLEGARQKLQGTMAYWDNRAVYVREVNERPNKDGSAMDLYASMSYLVQEGGKSFRQIITDPRLSYMEINVGYINNSGYAVWFCRMPYRQYRQGLRGDQCEHRDESGIARQIGLALNLQGFMGANLSTGKMMENTYPTLDDCVVALKDKSATKMAFHKDFAVYRDPLRSDFVIEYKGIPTAWGDMSMLFRCNPELSYLKEVIQEQNIRVA